MASSSYIYIVPRLAAVRRARSCGVVVHFILAAVDRAAALARPGPVVEMYAGNMRCARTEISRSREGRLENPVGGVGMSTYDLHPQST